MFFDKVKIYVKAGDGGNGSVSFHREKYISHGGPDGGDGGKGGDIVFVIDEGQNTLLNFKYRRKFVAQNGQAGMASKCHGKNAENLEIPVPPGTVIKDGASGKIIKDMFTLLHMGHFSTSEAKCNFDFITFQNELLRIIHLGIHIIRINIR